MVYLTFAMFLWCTMQTKCVFWLRRSDHGGRVLKYKSSLIHRFNTFNDPNNAATVFIAIFAFLMFNIH